MVGLFLALLVPACSDPKDTHRTYAVGWESWNGVFSTDDHDVNVIWRHAASCGKVIAKAIEGDWSYGD